MQANVFQPWSINCTAWSSNGRLVAFGGSSQKIHVHRKNVGGAIQNPADKHLSGHVHNVVSFGVNQQHDNDLKNLNQNFTIPLGLFEVLA